MRFPPARLLDSDLGVVHFPVRIGDKALDCAISFEALRDHFGAGERVLPAFDRGRSRIERIAAALINKGRFESNGGILIRTTDC